MINSTSYHYEEYYNFLYNLVIKNQLPQAILVKGNEGIGKKTFISNFLIDIKLIENNLKISRETISHNFFNNSLQNFRFVSSIDNTITIDQIRELISYCNKFSIDGKKKFILINNIEDLTINASNALLKLLENPPENTFFILLNNSEYKINNTIISRCFKLNIKFSSNIKNKIFCKLLKLFNLNNFENMRLLNKHDTPGLNIKKILYLREKKIENCEVLEIINYCLNDFKKNKNFNALKYGCSFAKNFYLNNYNNNFNKYYNLFQRFKDTINKSILFNADISILINKNNPYFK